MILSTVQKKKKKKNAQIDTKKVLQKYKKMSKKKTPFSFNLNDAAVAETVDYNNNTNINDISWSKKVQITAKKIIEKYKNLTRKRKSTFEIKEDIGPAKNHKVSIPNVRSKNAQIAAKKVVQKYKKISRKMLPLRSSWRWNGRL